MTSPKAEVELVTASWCKRCKEIKPDVQRVCGLVGVSYREVDYDDLEDDSPVKQSVTALPTIRVHLASAMPNEWRIFVPSQLDEWRNYMMNTVAFSQSPSAVDLDF